MIFHRVPVSPDPLLPGEPDAAHFGRLMDLITDHFNVLSLREACKRLRSGTLPARAASITFDDGYANNYEVALPILTARRIPATVFVAPGFLNGGYMFNDLVIESIRCAPTELDLREQGLEHFLLPDNSARIAALETIVPKLKYLEPSERVRRSQEIADLAGASPPANLMMTDAQVLALHRAGIEIGAHTMQHPILTRVAPEEARAEMLESKRRLEEIIGAPVRSFAYPNGKPHSDYNATHVALARECGFDCALSTAWGAATMNSDMHQIPRIAPWDRSARRYIARAMGAYRQRSYESVS
jgi:peptidoglycan/xylan/chitin deacetylase (PgdA/CDA1 family)